MPIKIKKTKKKSPFINNIIKILINNESNKNKKKKKTKKNKKR